MDSPYIVISEGEGKWHKTSSSPSAGINHDEVDWSAIVYEQAVVDGPDTTDGFTAIFNRGSANNNGTTD